MSACTEHMFMLLCSYHFMQQTKNTENLYIHTRVKLLYKNNIAKKFNMIALKESRFVMTSRQAG